MTIWDVINNTPWYEIVIPYVVWQLLRGTVR